MFRSFQKELHRPNYGLTKPVGTYNLLKLQYHEYGNIIGDVRGARGLRNKLGYIFAPPGWQPKGLPHRPVSEPVETLAAASFYM
jgi:hypothetical protein